MEIDKKIDILNDKVDYLIKLCEDHILLKQDCKDANTQNLIKILENSGLNNHPLFKTIISAFTDNLKGEKDE